MSEAPPLSAILRISFRSKPTSPRRRSWHYGVSSSGFGAALRPPGGSRPEDGKPARIRGGGDVRTQVPGRSGRWRSNTGNLREFLRGSGGKVHMGGATLRIAARESAVRGPGVRSGPLPDRLHRPARPHRAGDRRGRGRRGDRRGRGRCPGRGALRRPLRRRAPRSRGAGTPRGPHRRPRRVSRRFAGAARALRLAALQDGRARRRGAQRRLPLREARSPFAATAW